MTDPLDFGGLLNQQADEVVKPNPVPQGQFLGVIDSFEMGKSTKKKTPYVRFQWKLLQASSDIPVEEFKDVNWEGKLIKEEFYITADALYRLTDFFALVMDDIAGRSVKELIDQSVGHNAWLDIGHELSDNGENTYVNIIGHAKAQ